MTGFSGKRDGGGKRAETAAAVERAQKYFLDIEGPRRRRRTRVIVLSILFTVLVLAGALSWAVFYSPVLLVRAVAVEGVRVLSPDAVREAARSAAARSRIGKILGPDMILAWSPAVADAVAPLFPRARAVAIEVSYRARTVLVRVEERAPRAIFCARGAADAETSPSACFWMDDDGILFDRAPSVEGNLIPLLADYSNAALSAGDRVLPERFVGNLFSVFRVLDLARVSAAEIRIDDRGLEELTVKTHDGPALYFSLRFPADYALAVLESFRNGRARFPELEYIDFRVEGRAYYK